MRSIWQQDKKTKIWKVVAYGCVHCDNIVKSLHNITKHIENCKDLQERKRIKEFKYMPIQTVTIDGEKMYRYGDTGKLYKDRKDAEIQARSFYSAGYRESLTVEQHQTKGKQQKVMK